MLINQSKYLTEHVHNDYFKILEYLEDTYPKIDCFYNIQSKVHGVYLFFARDRESFITRCIIKHEWECEDVYSKKVPEILEEIKGHTGIRSCKLAYYSKNHGEE